MEALQTALQPVIVGLDDLQSSKYVYGASLTILLWDYVLTFEEERNTIWAKRLSLLQILFYLNRYITIAYQLFNVISFSLPPHLLSDALCVLGTFRKRTTHTKK
ncbi:hypothetical protein EXIGLDRAFT_697218 [Exidia glandulosa HHB12029]|uniref:DUF6533 domain-containing protein n=1 Tax=Exidia glandulosa HHB12029 TaxID=1314781 RepID=A0A165EWA6_EXIGL|nr:hypothetical protein EXIGLDRAFT_697218 [Exidia glandulosa HHB12029]